MKAVAIYARVFSAEQKADLDCQVARLALQGGSGGASLRSMALSARPSGLLFERPVSYSGRQEDSVVHLGRSGSITQAAYP